MPSLLTTLADFSDSDYGAATEAIWSALDDVTLHRMIMRQSERVERYCRRVFAAPPATSVGGSVTLASGSLQVPVTQIANIHATDVLVFTGSGEAREVQSVTFGGANTDGVSYFGTVAITAPTASTYSVGAPIQVYRQCRHMVRGARTLGGSQDINLSQAGQLAAAHAPKLLSAGQNSLRIFLAEYPVWSVYAAFQVTPYAANTEAAVNLTADYLMVEQGYLKLPFGFWNPPGSVWRVQYMSGWQQGALPGDIVDATHAYIGAALLRLQNPMGAASYRIGDISVTGVGGAWITDAQATLSDNGWPRVGQ